MKHLAAYLLLALGGNSSPSAKDITTVLESVGIEADEERLTKLISELKGKDLQEVCETYTLDKSRMLIHGS
jgi:large subunit ribosomal protein LP2